MEAGSELDKLIAEKVMGWRLEMIGLGNDMPCYCELNGPVGSLVEEWEPSTYILCAWKVVEKMDEDGFSFHFGSRGETEFDKEFLKYHFMFSTKGSVYRRPVEVPRSSFSESAPHAICLAALKAVGYDIIPQDKET